MPDQNQRALLVSRMVAEGTSDDDIRATLKAFDAQQEPSPVQSSAPTTDRWASLKRTAGGAPASELWQRVKDNPVQSGAMLGSALLTGGASPLVAAGRAALGAAGGAGYGIAADAVRNGPSASIKEDVGTMAGAGALAGGLVGGAQAAANAIPSAARAGQRFQNVMSAAKATPVDVSAPGEVGLRIMQIAERGGGSLPRPVSQFLQRITNPDKTPLLYEEARDFASGISRLSANEMGRLSPAVAREVAGLRVALNKSVADAAGKAGKGAEYSKAMTEYAKAMRLRKLIDDTVTGAKRAIPVAGAGAGAYWLTKKISDLLPGGD